MRIVVVDHEHELSVLLEVVGAIIAEVVGFEFRLEGLAGCGDGGFGGVEIILVAPSDVAGGELIADGGEVGVEIGGGEGEEGGNKDGDSGGQHLFSRVEETGLAISIV